MVNGYANAVGNYNFSKLTIMQKEKIGQGYYQSGYGRGFNKRPIVWLINGKAYVKNSRSTPFQTDLKGYTMVNLVSGYFFEVGIISKHEQYKK